MRKIPAVCFMMALVVAILLIDRDQELEEHNHKLETWRDYCHKWNDLPCFSKERKWLVEGTFDHNAHWKRQMEMIRQQASTDLGCKGEGEER